MLQHVDSRRADADARASADRDAPISVAEAWKRYHDAVRRGLPCEGDVPPHPGVVAGILAIVSLRTLTRPLRTQVA
ncbi:MAG: hypothetical protein QM775_31735 [Pirellulales bacterium]